MGLFYVNTFRKVHSNSKKKSLLLCVPDEYMSLDTFHMFMTLHTTAGRDSSVGVATRYGLDGPGIATR